MTVPAPVWAAALAAAAVLVTAPGRGRRPPGRPSGGRARRSIVAPRAWTLPTWTLPTWESRLSRLGWGACAVVLLVAPPAVGLGCLAVAAVLTAGAVRAERARVARTRELADLVADGASTLAADLSAGHPPLAALAALAADWTEPPSTVVRAELARSLSSVAAAGRLGGDVPAGLRAAATRPGAEGLRDLAAGWQVAEATGAALSTVLDHIAEGLRRQRAAERRITVALGGARASARLLVGLPALGLVIGAGLGVSPLGFLLGTGPGKVCLVAGIGLSLLGMRWTDRLAASAAAAARW